MDRKVAVLLAALGCAIAIAGCDEPVAPGVDSGPGGGDSGPRPDGGGGDSGGGGDDGGAPAVCGDGAIDDDETCDDGNTAADDGCSATCAIEAGWSCAGTPSTCTPDCGDGALAGMEECDDGNAADGDGCSAACDEESGWACDGAEPTVCTSTCGDGVSVGTEGCDDGNTAAGDGCDGACAVETGYACMGTEPSVCGPDCGDGMMIGTEACDDGNTADGDGCSMACGVEAGWSCAGMPSACTTTCGDGVVAGPETCDDGNTVTEACTYGLMTCMVCADDCTMAAGATSYCGDGTTDAANGETCDDGNTADGDGCSAACALEEFCGDGVVNGTEVCDDGNTVGGDCCSAACDATSCDEAEDNGDFGTASPLTLGTPVTGSIAPAGDIDFWSFTLAVQSHVTIETFDGTGTACAGIDTFISLMDVDGTTVLGTDDDGGIPLCSLIEPGVDAFARNLPAGTYYVRARAYSATAVIPIYTLSVTATPAVCGDGYPGTPEECDDGGTAAGDGCSATCTIESGYTCMGTPSSCFAPAPNGTCGTATAISSSTTLVGEDARGGGAPPTATGCGTGTGTTTLYYSITVPAGATATITVTPTSTPAWDPVAFRLDTCADAACSDLADETFGGGTEVLSIENTTGASITHVVGVRAYSATTSGTFDLDVAFSTCGDGAVGGPEGCDDGGTTAGDGCSATCTAEPGYLCTGAPSVCVLPYTTTTITAACVDASAGTVVHMGEIDDGLSTATALPFPFTYFREAMTHYRISTNGWMQLAPSSTIAGADSAYTNQSIPQTSTPNGVIAAFWDDLVVRPGGTVRTVTTGTAGSRRFVVEWNDAEAYADATVSVTFQAHVLEGTNVIELHHCSMTTTGASMIHTGSSATIGIENASGTAAVETSFDTAGAVTSGMGYRYTPTP